MRVGFQILPEFTVVQHERDVRLLQALQSFFGCGVVRRNHGDRSAYRVRRRSELLATIVPFFLQHPLRSCKRADFEVFRHVLQIMQEGDHLSTEGVIRIRALVGGMNRGRSR